MDRTGLTAAGLLGGVALFGSSAGAQCFDSQSSVATYDVVFIAEWSEGTHPTSFPFDPHFSPLIGATHSGAVSFWEPGGIASPGIERMAETGGIGPLRNEVNDSIAQGTAALLLTGGGIAVSPDQVGMTFDIAQDFPLVTLVTMIAPSPDWFVGVHGLALRDDAGWVPVVEVDLWAYDAGTDSGVDYTSPNQDTNPQEPIRNITGEFPFAGHGRIGRFVFTQRASAAFPDFAEPCGVLNFFDVAAYIGAFSNGDASADVAAPFGELNFFDVAAYISAFANGAP